MTQTKRQSLIETLTSTFTGMIGSWLITMACLYNITDKTTAATVTVIGCTVWSLVRGYAVRRYFNNVVAQNAEV